MSVLQPPVFDLASAAALLDGERRGSTEILGALDGLPLLMVDLDTSGDTAALTLPAILPCVIVGFSHRGAPDGALDGALD
ncbi:MAG: hypothetical protein ACYCV7_15880, partial [Acidimicrobiales bacterium]